MLLSHFEQDIISFFGSDDTEGLPKTQRVFQKHLTEKILNELHCHGKTALAQLVSLIATEKNLKVVAISFAGYVVYKNTKLNSGSHIEKEINIFSSYFKKMVSMEWTDIIANSETLLIIDDAHNIFHVEEFWSMFKAQSVQSGFQNNNLCGLLATSTYGVQAIRLGNISSPSCFTVKYYFKDIVLDYSEYIELVNEFRKDSKGDHKDLALSQTFIDAVWSATQGHIGLCRLALNELTKAPKNWVGDIELQLSQFIFNGQLTKQLENSRAFAGISILKELTGINLSELQNILKEVIQKGYVPLNAINSNFLSSLLKVGVFNEDGLNLFFSCPIVEQFYRKEYIKNFIHPSPCLLPSLSQVEQEGITEFVYKVLENFDGSLLRSTFSRNVNGSYIERIYQNEFYCSAWMIMPARLSSDVGTYFGVKGAVDFYLNDQFKWAFELLRDGKKLKEHSERFQPGKRYSGIEMNDWAVIDFCIKGSSAAWKNFPQDSNHYCLVMEQDSYKAILYHNNNNKSFDLKQSRFIKYVTFHYYSKITRL
ncbi:8383_t:CDS:2 [Entrophospora sp. SA101]|nr:8383_t:CDS:2 [Entrophospora sp. SA101]